MSSEITCLIVDDHEVVRQGLRLALERFPAIRIVGEANDGETALALAERRRPDVVLLDIRMPGLDGIATAQALHERLPETAILLFSGYSERSLLERGLEAGARGYLLKETPPELLLAAIERLAQGERYLDPALTPALLSDERRALLTAREREVLSLLAEGMVTTQVAKHLFISEETVKSHVRHILRKLDAETRTEAVAIGIRESIID